MSRVYDVFAEEYIDENEKDPFAPPERYVRIPLNGEPLQKEVPPMPECKGPKQEGKMRKTDFIDMIHQIEKDILDCYDDDLISDQTAIRDYYEMRGVHLMASNLLDKLDEEEQDNENA